MEDRIKFLEAQVYALQNENQKLKQNLNKAVVLFKEMEEDLLKEIEVLNFEVL